MADKPVAEVVDVDAVIDALSPSPTSSDVYEATLPFNPHAVAASAVRRAGEGGGGGGSSGLEVIGPFPVAWDEPDLATGVTLASLTDGQLVISAWAIAHDIFDGGGLFTIAVIADPGRDDVATLGGGQGEPAGLFPVVIGGLAFFTQCLVVGAGTLKAIYENSPTHGLVDVYALVWTPS